MFPNCWSPTPLRAHVVSLFSCVGFPKQVVTDQWINFMSETWKAMWRVLGIQPLRMSVYYTQMNGLIERFNGTLKLLLRKYMEENRRKGPYTPTWCSILPLWLLFLLFEVQEVLQASLGVSPFELLFGRHPPGGGVACFKERMRRDREMAHTSAHLCNGTQGGITGKS